jgi:hypothetical protein
MNNVFHPQKPDCRWSWLYIIGSVSALITGMVLLIGEINLIFSILNPAITNSWLVFFENNWLILIFKMHAGFNTLPAGLSGLDLLDMVILSLVSLVSLSLSNVFTKTRRIWSIAPFFLTLIGIILFTVTKIAGRSTVMLDVLIISLLMLKNKTSGNGTIITGILAGVLLLVGDLSVGIHSNFITILFCMGYMLIIVWFFLIAMSLFRTARFTCN